MLFLADTAFALELIAIGVGFFVLLKAQKDESGSYRGLGRFLGYFILILAFFALLCTSYYAVRNWEDGRFRSSPPMMGAMMGAMHGNAMGNVDGCGMKAGRMGGGDKDGCPMMDQKGGMMKHGSGKMEHKGKMMDQGSGMMDKKNGMMGKGPDHMSDQ